MCINGCRSRSKSYKVWWRVGSPARFLIFSVSDGFSTHLKVRWKYTGVGWEHIVIMPPCIHLNLVQMHSMIHASLRSRLSSPKTLKVAIRPAISASAGTADNGARRTVICGGMHSDLQWIGLDYTSTSVDITTSLSPRSSTVKWYFYEQTESRR